MRRFVRSFFVRRKAQVTVIQDGDSRQFEVWVWRPRTAPAMVRHFPYAPGAASFVRDVAVRAAVDLASAEKGHPDTREAL
ncbi:MAG: hypothetical protein V4597_08475 [Pseudomonadota bacterium]